MINNAIISLSHKEPAKIQGQPFLIGMQTTKLLILGSVSFASHKKLLSSQVSDARALNYVAIIRAINGLTYKLCIHVYVVLPVSLKMTFVNVVVLLICLLNCWVQQQRIFFKIIMFHKILQDPVSVSFTLVPFITSTHGHSIRFVIPFARTDNYKHSFLPRLPLDYGTPCQTN